MVWNNNLKLWNIIKGEKMVKAELIENPTESEIVKVDNVPDVDVAIEQWDAYQRLCKGLLNDSDYQEIIVKEKDENGNYVKVKRHFKKKSAWQKLSRAFNVDTEIVDRDIERTKMGRVREAYYCVRASLMLKVRERKGQSLRPHHNVNCKDTCYKPCNS